MSDDRKEIGVWHRHAGGESPVPNGAVVDILWYDKTRAGVSEGREWDERANPRIAWNNVVAYRISSLPPVEKTRSGTCWAYDTLGIHPTLASHNVAGTCAYGAYTVTTLDGKPKRILWEAESAQ